MSVKEASASKVCLDWFSLHAPRAVEPRDREGLERLCRYGLRAPFSQDRLSVGPDGQSPVPAAATPELCGRLHSNDPGSRHVDGGGGKPGRDRAILAWARSWGTPWLRR